MSSNPTPPTDPAKPKPVAKNCTIIEPPRGWHLANLRELWAYNELLYFLTWRDVVVRYKQTVLGAAWTLVQPLITTVLFTVVFGWIIGLNDETGGEPYPVFLLAGLLPWNLFSGGLAGASGSVLNSSGIITKIYFPRILIPIASVGVNLVNFAVSFAMLLLLMLYYGMLPGPQLLLLPVVVALIFVCTLSIGIGLSATMVIYRDVQIIAPYFLQILLYLTPVIYPVRLVPERYQWLLALNPMTGLLDAFRWCLYGKPFTISSLVFSIVIITIGLVISSFIFRRAEAQFADII